MPRRKKYAFSAAAERFAYTITAFSGSTPAFLIAAGIIVVWALLGPVFGFSDTWQLVINTGTTIVTFLMVFLIQRMQNKDSLALHLKLNELIAAVEGASNRLVNVEDLTEDELNTLHSHFKQLSGMAKGDASLKQSHSVEEARGRHEAKEGQAREPGMTAMAQVRFPPDFVWGTASSSHQSEGGNVHNDWSGRTISGPIGTQRGP